MNATRLKILQANKQWKTKQIVNEINTYTLDQWKSLVSNFQNCILMSHQNESFIIGYTLTPEESLFFTKEDLSNLIKEAFNEIPSLCELSIWTLDDTKPRKFIRIEKTEFCKRLNEAALFIESEEKENVKMAEVLLNLNKRKYSIQEQQQQQEEDENESLKSSPSSTHSSCSSSSNSSKKIKQETQITNTAVPPVATVPVAPHPPPPPEPDDLIKEFISSCTVTSNSGKILCPDEIWGRFVVWYYTAKESSILSKKQFLDSFNKMNSKFMYQKPNLKRKKYFSGFSVHVSSMPTYHGDLPPKNT